MNQGGILIAHTLRADGFDASEDGTGRGTPLVPCVAPTLFSSNGGVSSGYHPVIPIDMRQVSRGATMTNNRPEGSSGGAPGTGVGEPGDPAPSLSLSHPPAIAFQERGRADGRNLEWQEDQSYALRAIDGGGCGDWFRLAHHSAVRRLTPLECERLQGFPDGWTQVTYRGKPAADGPRYKAIGNSMAVPVLIWLGQRIQLVDSLPA